MKTFEIDTVVFEQLPDYCVGVVVAKGLSYQAAQSVVAQELQAQVEKTHADLMDKNIRELPTIQAFRQAMEKVGINPNKFMCSIEALTKRVQKQAQLPSIHVLVDLGNCLSLKHRLPVGIHRLDSIQKKLSVRFAEETDRFLPMGGDKPESVPVGELVYASGDTVKTRRWIWRQSEDSKMIEEIRDVICVIDGFSKGAVCQARDELAQALQKYSEQKVVVDLVNAETPTFLIEA